MHSTSPPCCQIPSNKGGGGTFIKIPKIKNVRRWKAMHAYYAFYIFRVFLIVSIFIILNSKKYKNKDIRMKFSITMGILIAMLSIPRLVSYDLIICLPVIFYLITQLNINKNKIMFFDIKNILFL